MTFLFHAKRHWRAVPEQRFGPLERAMVASYQVRRWAAAVFVVCLLYVLYLLFVRPLLPHNVPGTVDLRLMSVSSSSNGVMLVSVVLTNSTPLALNVLDGADGRPAFILDDGSEQTWLTPMVNKCNISLAPGGSLTNVVLVTNCPPQFRLKLAVVYLGRDSRDWPLPVGRLLPEPWRSRFAEWDQKRKTGTHWKPASRWILPGLPENMPPVPTP